MRRCITLVAFGLIVTASLSTVPAATTRPATQPSVVPPDDAPKLIDRIGKLDAVTIRFWQWKADQVESWDVVIRDREILSRFESMRRSDWREIVLFTIGYEITLRGGEAKFSGRAGQLKLADVPYGLRLVGPDGRWGLFVETGETASKLRELVEKESLRQRPEEPMIDRAK